MIRPARTDDAAQLAALAVELGYDNTAESMRARLQDLLPRDGHAVLVYEHEGKIAGWGHLRISRQLQSDSYAELTGLVVSQDVRSLGIGAQLLAAAEDWARGQGQKELRLRSNMIRERAHRFYLERGYAELKRSKTFGKKL